MSKWLKGLLHFALWALSVGAFGWVLTAVQPAPSLTPTEPTQAQLETEAEFIAIRDGGRCPIP